MSGFEYLGKSVGDNFSCLLFHKLSQRVFGKRINDDRNVSNPLFCLERVCTSTKSDTHCWSMSNTNTGLNTPLLRRGL